MITKAIVEEVIDPYNIRVRIPSLDRTTQTSTHTRSSELNVAIVCTLPGCDPNIQPGDVVFVSMEKREIDEAVIIGYLYRTKKTDTLCDFILSRLEVVNDTKLSENTSIGDVSPFEIQQLIGVQGNLQSQINELNKEIELLKNTLLPST